jgi:hypothetical protein
MCLSGCSLAGEVDPVEMLEVLTIEGIIQ